MDLLTREELHLLFKRQGMPCVSLFLPTHRKGPETQQNPIRFKNLLRHAEAEMGRLESTNDDPSAVLDPARALLGNDFFWLHQSDGLAVFLSSQFTRTFRLPMEMKELVVVSHRFHVKPLLSFLAYDGKYYVLAISQNRTRLLQCTRQYVQELEAESLPKSLSEGLRYDEPESQLQFHTGTQKGPGKRAAMFHGHGVGTDDSKDRILRYFQILDDGVQEALRNEKAPLVLSAVDYLHAIYREANTFPHLLDQGVYGNPDELRPEELKTKAWEIVEPVFQHSRHDALDKHAQLAGTGKTSEDLREVLASACQGRVAVLFVEEDKEIWGSFHLEDNAVTLHEEPRAGSDDLLDLAAAQTLSKGGDVHVVSRQDMPEEAPIAAIYRYEVAGKEA